MYLFDTTEKNNATANEYETKSMLYLMAMRDDSPNIDMFIIDCFNDVTGACENIDELWDVQSKGVKSLNPRKIGIALATLFMNYRSSMSFKFYILFMPKLKEGYLVDESLKVFNYSNIKITKNDKVILGLQEEYLRRKKIKNDSSLNADIAVFLNEVMFVIADEENEQYVKNLIDFRKKDQWSDEFYLSLFNEIRDMQSSIKNISIDGKSINDKKEIVKFNKILKRSQLEALVINRLVGMDVFITNAIPINFHEEIKGLDIEEVQDMILDCKAQITRTLFNKSLKIEFWKYFEFVIDAIKSDPNKNPRQVHTEIPKQIIDKIFTLKEKGSIYFIAMIKGGLI